MNDKIQQALTRLFDKHRIVFWYDVDRDLRKQYDSVEIAGVEKLDLANNEFAVKYRVLREQPQTKFLIYKHGPQPDDIQNWMLDVQLAHGEFRTDQGALWLGELGLGYEFAEIVRDHAEFFNAQKRRDSLKRLVKADDTQSRIRLKMLAVCAASDSRLDSIIESLLSEHSSRTGTLARPNHDGQEYSGQNYRDGQECPSSGKSDKLKLVERSGLADFLWEQIQRSYGYVSETPGIHDFVIELFKSCYAMGTDGEVRLSAEALVFLKRWKDSRQHEAAFEELSKRCADLLRIEDDLNRRDYRDIIELDYFELIDRKILSDLAARVLDRDVTAGECTVFIRQRRASHWYGQLEHEYEAIDHAARFIKALDSINLEIDSLSHGILKYVASFYGVDQLYRKFIYHFRQCRQVTLLEGLANEIRNKYTNAYLRPLGDRWQQLVDEMDEWKIPGAESQETFYAERVKRFLDKNNKIYVIVSDALRYEIADELASLIRQEDRYDAELKAMITKLPSYTQLGMAALLPHGSLEINNDKMGSVTVDGISSQGIANRQRILNQACSGAALAIGAEELLAKNRDECRELVRDHDVVFVYQNRIDKTGHTRDTETRVFDAAEEAMDELVKIVKKLAGANASNMLITADHGFVYQDEVEESDYSIAEPSGSKITTTDRRFVLGEALSEGDGVKHFTSAQLGLEGNVEVLLPKSINRFRKRGSGTRFIHGGCTLQEIVVPVIEINKRRQSDVSAVDVDIIRSASSVISSGQLAVALYQSEPISDKVQPRTLRVGIYAENGELISDSQEYTFDLASDNPREREIKIRLVLSKRADAFNKQQVMFRMEEPVPGTSHFQEYKSIAYTLRRSFTSDFDFE